MLKNKHLPTLHQNKFFFLYLMSLLRVPTRMRTKIHALARMPLPIT